MKTLFGGAFFGLFAAMVGCSAADSAPPDEDEAAVVDEALAAPVSTYYVVSRDMRKCASPLCGGYFVRRVNRANTRCADGQMSDACYVASLDLHVLGLSTHEEERLTGSVTTDLEASVVVLRGTVRQGGATHFGRLGEFRATEAWLANAPVAVSGAFYRVKDSGIVCITTPCGSLTGTKLNVGTRRTLAELDLNAAPGTEFDHVRAMSRLATDDGLLVAGTTSVVTGPAGRARGLLGSQYYERVVHEPGVCGSSDECSQGQLCCYPCGIAGCKNRCIDPDPVRGGCPLFP